MSIILQRVSLGPVNPTYGVIVKDGFPLCVTLERPWLDNKNGVSCIPEGAYRVTKFISPSKGDVFLLHNVPGRTMIEMHVANYVTQLEGCIGVGARFSDACIANSKQTLDLLLTSLPDEFELYVKNPPPTT